MTGRYEARHMATDELAVRCPDGTVRHDHPFTGIVDAETWAQDHGCLPEARHQIVQAETLGRLMARSGRS